MPRLPVSLDLAGRTVVVVGGGLVATRRVERLLEAAAAVHIVAPQASPSLARWASSGALVWHQQRWQDYADRMAALSPVWLVLTATDDPTTNAHVAAWSQQRGIWCSRADTRDSPLWFPAVARDQGIEVSVTALSGPREAQAVRDRIVASWQARAANARPSSGTNP